MAPGKIVIKNYLRTLDTLTGIWYLVGMKTNKVSDVMILELSRRNLETLLEKLGDPDSACSLISPDRDVIVKAVENEEHYSDRDPGPMWTNGEWK